MITYAFRTVLLCFLPLSVISTQGGSAPFAQLEPSTGSVRVSDQESNKEEAVIVHYLEIVTPEVNATCEALKNQRGVSFGEPISELGHARTAPLEGGGLIGVRAPMRETEAPVVRPYILVEDIDAAVGAAQAAGGEIALPPTEIPGKGKFAIYILGGIQHGLWQL